MTMERIRAVNVDRIDLDEAVELLAFAKLFDTEFTATGIPVPEFLTDAIGSLKNEIAARQKDARAKRLKQIRAAQAGLRTTEEKRADLAKEAEELEALLK